MAENMTTRGPWPGEKGVIPEPPQNAADSNRITREYMDNILVEARLLDSGKPDITMELFGEKFSSPIMMPAFSHLNSVLKNGRKPMQEYAQAAKDLNLVNFVGMEPDEEFASIASVGARTIRIIKPFADWEIIYSQIEAAQKSGAFGVGIDIDHAFGTDGNFDVVDGYTMAPLSSDALAEFISYAKVPFVVKGVMSVQDAVRSAQAGAAAVFVSHHHGRIPFSVAPLQVLPDICRALRRFDIKIFVDCGIMDGRDAYKALAMGADAVSVGRGILPGLLKEGTPAVEKKVQKMNEELGEMMGYTGVKSLKEMDSSVLWMKNGGKYQ